MAILRAFKAIRPNKNLASKVASLPYDVMNSDEARKIANNNPFSFLHVDKSEIDLDINVDIYDKKVYKKAKENLSNMIEKNILIKDEKPCLFVYRLVMNGRSQTGLVGCTSIDDYLNDVIKKHEHTREDKESDRTNHVDICNANTGPIFLTYRYDDEINYITNQCTDKEPIYQFLAEDNVEHIVWAINEENIIKKISNLFEKIHSLYIADGHHRSASAVKVGMKRRAENPNYTGDEEFNYFLSVAFPDRDLKIMDYNRVVTDINGLSPHEYKSLISEKFNINLFKGDSYKPLLKHHYGMFMNGKWYELSAKTGTYNPKDPVDRLDVSILQNNLLNPVLGIEDPRIDKRIDFIGGIRGLKALEKRVEQCNSGVAFSMYPTTVEDLIEIGDAKKVMPPKSTWFEPKLRSGLFIHSLK